MNNNIYNELIEELNELYEMKFNDEFDNYELDVRISEIELQLEELDRAESERRDERYYSANRTEFLAKYFFKLLERGGSWSKLFKIRDLLFEEYIIHGGCSQVEILQIDDIIEEALEGELFDNEPVIEMNYLEELINNIYRRMWEGDIEGAILLLNEYGNNAHSNPYIYYCAVCELERVTGEEYLQLDFSDMYESESEETSANEEASVSELDVNNNIREIYRGICERYKQEVWNGEDNEVSDTLEYYEESVVHYGEGVDVGFTFLIDELTNYGEEGLIATIKDIVRMKQ
jgi:hypothetical protein